MASLQDSPWYQITQALDGRKLIAFHCADCKEAGRAKGSGSGMVMGWPGETFDWQMWLNGEYTCLLCKSRRVRIEIDHLPDHGSGS